MTILATEPLPRIIALLASAMLCGLLAAFVMRAGRRDRAIHGPAFRRIARGIGLGPLEQRSLIRLARLAEYPTPACLLISRGCFDAAVERASCESAREGALIRLRQRIFD